LTKLSVKFVRNRLVLIGEDRPDPEEAKRLWREGKSAQYILEQTKKERRRKKREK
jgi:hypothetical protein